MKKNTIYFILLWVGLVICSSLAQSATNLFPTGSISNTNIVLPGQSPGPEDDTNVDVFVPDIDARFPIAIVLQGGLVNASQYSQFGKQLARHGFLVAIPNRLSLLGPPPPVPFPDEIVVLEVLAQLDVENGDPTSPLHRQVDTKRMGIVGHSVGGFVGLLVVEGSCVQPFCFGGFQRPAALQAGAFYGTNSIDPFSGQLIDIDTGAIPVALVQGSQDGLSTPDDGQATFDILDGPRVLITIDGANHFGITNDNPPPGAIPDFSPQLISQSESIQQIADSMGGFLCDRIFGLSVSTSANRDNPLPLMGQSLSGDAFIFLTPLLPSAAIDQVDFILDGSFAKTESSAPYDLRGTNGSVANSFNTRNLANGSHAVQANIIFSSGSQSSISNTFSVFNAPVSGDDDDDDDDDDD